MPKFESSIKVSGIQSLSGNTTLLHLGPDNRVGIGTTAPDTKLHVDGAITASGLIVPSGVLSSQGDSAAAFGFNPNFDEWNGPPDNSPYVANGYTQDTETTGRVIQSSDSNLGGASAKFDNVDARWERPVKFESPLYRNIFVQGTVTYKYESYSSGEPGLAVTLTSRPRACNEYVPMTNTFIVPTLSENRQTATGWQTVTWRAHTPADREITDLKVEVISTSIERYNAETREDVINDGGAGPSLTLGGGIGYEWYLDGFSLQFMHPDMRIDQLGRITGAYIAEATIDDLHIRDMISSTSSLVQREGTALYIQGEVANATYANGWSISKSGKIKATDIEIYSGSGQILIDANARDGDGHYNPFARWQGRSLADLDSDASSRLYGLNFEESNKTDLFIKTGYRATTGLDSDTIGTNDFSLYIANSTGTTLPDSGTGSTQLSNGSINFNGMTSNAPPGSIFTDGKSVVQGLRGSSDGTAAYILFLANTQKWDSNHGAQQKYHANTLLGEYGLYVIGKPTVGGWLYHPHANNTWYTIDEVQQGDRLHLKDFITIGKVGTDDAGNIIDSLTSLESPRALDSVTSDDSRGSFPPLGIPAGGILFADIYPNQWNHTANSGEVQLTNQKNSPNTRFAFIHPTSGTRYIANSSQGILTSLEDFPGSRYITFIGGNKTRTNPDGTGFTFDYDGHSPDFIAAFPLGNRWYYNQDEGKMSEFIPDPNIDCIVARVDSNGASFSGDGSSKITQVYRYAQREAVTEEGASLSDLIIDPPRGMASGGLVLADLTINREFQKSDNTFIANSGFIALSNPENNPRNEFYVIHPDNGNNWLVDTVGRGVATSLNPTNDVYGTRHIAFVGGDNRSLDGYVPRFPAIASHYNVANDFIAVAKYDTNGNPRSDGQWYYDPGTGISDSHTFAPIANDFIIATLSSFDPDTDGIDQITRWAAEEGQLIIDGVPTSITSIRNLLNDRIDAANTVAQTALSEAQSAFANAVTAQANVAQALGLLDGAITIYFEEEDASRYYANAASSGNFDYNDLWINISTYNKAIDGSWYANAVFRYSNSLGGFADTGGTEAGTDHTNKLAWRHDPTNPAGLSYLIGLTARGFADRSTTVYYRDSIGTPPNLFGPNVAVMSLTSSDVGELNFNPEGDLWYDTKSAFVGEAPANHPYVYRTNATFSNSTPSRSGYITTGVGAWAQTVHNVGTSGTWNRNTAQTGWWSLQDSSAGDAAAGIAAETARRENAITAEAAQRAVDIASTLNTAKVFAQAAADREILAFFADSTDTPPPSSGNGDVWIHTDTAIDITTGTVNTGSVFVANTNSPPGSYSAGAINPPERYWHQSPENAIGRSFLEGYVSTYAVNSIAYTAMATGNGKVVAFFGPHWPLDTGTHGPLVNTTPSGLENPDAHGDFWINTSNNNLMFVYNQNNSSITTEPDKAYSQTIYWDSSVGFSFNKSSDRSGWYSTEDPRTTNALSTSFDALANAETAQAAADREIAAFFAGDTSGIESGAPAFIENDGNNPTATGNGDIWIKTDSFATLNTNSIYVYHQQYSPARWIQSPTSAIGQVYLNAFLAERKASRAESLAISVTGSGDLPFPVAPDANGIFVGATGNLAFYRNSSTEYLTDQFGSSHEGHVYVTNRGGVDLVGPNGHIWYPYSSGFGIPEEGTVGTNFYTGGATSDSLTVSNSTFSSLYLMYSNMNAATRFSGGTGTPFGTHDHIVPVRWNNVDGQHQWEAVERNGTLHDFIPDAANGDFLVAKLTRPTAVPEGFSTLDSWIFKTLPSQTQAFTDGKIVTHFGPQFPEDTGTHGPQANLTPTGLYNPEPHGDFWINTSNNNIVFRYHSNTINKYAQTAYHAPFRPETNDNKSGWYSTEDLRTANSEAYNANNQIWLTNINGNVFTLNAASANAQLFINFAFANIAFVNGAAYNAQAAADLARISADREILAYFQIHSDVPEATGNGDVWIHTDNLIDPADGTLNPAAIFVANTHDTVVGIPDKTVSPDHWWYSSPENAIGLMYAKSYAAGHAGEFQSTNIMPRAWSLFDASSSLYSNTAPLRDTVPYPIDDLSGGGMLWEIVDDQNPPSGGKALYLKKQDSYNDYGFLATSGHTVQSGWAKSITIPRGKKWILSWYAKNAAGATTEIDSGIWHYLSNTFITESDTSYPYPHAYNRNGFEEGGTQNFVGTDWERHWSILDLTGGTDGTGTLGDITAGIPTVEGTPFSTTDLATGINQLVVRIGPGGHSIDTSIENSPTYYAGFQLEDVTASGRVVPSEFQEPSDTSALIFDREITDGKIVTQFYASKPQSIGYGPQANVTPTGLPNPEPHGDFLVDTSNNNIMFRYHQNIPSARVWSPDSTFAQTLIYTSPAPGDADGWYALEDPRTSNALATAHNANAVAHAANTTAQEALQKAASAASAADAEILVFFESSTNASMYLDTYSYGHGADSGVGPATGNGDIWIQVDQVYNPDGTQNTGSIFFANLSPSEGWSQSPDNAIGRAFLESFTTTGVKNWMPAGYSTWNEEQQNFFGAPIVYNIGEGAVHNADTPYPVRTFSNGKAIVNTSFGYTDSGSLQLTTTSGTAAESYLNFANTDRVASKESTAAGPPSTTLRIPRGKRWIFSYYAFTNTAFTDTNGDATTTSVFLWMDNSANTTANVGLFYKNRIKHTPNQWKRHSHVLDLSNSSPSATIDEYTDKYGSWSSATSHRFTYSSGTTDLTEPVGGWQHPLVADFDSITVRFDVDGAIGNTFWFDGIQLEEAPGAQVLAGPFSDPDRRVSDHFTRAISDGKIVSHYANGTSSGGVYYGPRPQVTPSGTINPVPHGDFWIDTANNNATYRYNQNNSYPLPTTMVGASSISAVAQTAFWSTVAYENNKTGWYSVADGRIGILAGNVATAFSDIADTLSQVSDLEAATDGEINIYFKPADGVEFVTGGGPGTGGTPGSYAYGDIWINVADSQKYANGTLNPTSIHRRSNSSGGFHDASSLPVAGDAYRWMPEPDNAIGGVYLSAYAAQNLADSKVTSFFTGNTNGGNEFLDEEGPGGNPVHLYGPQANLTPTGHINTNPDGDIWINTANNNEMYVYNVNGGGGAGGYRQRVYWSNSMEGGDEGWYSAEDLRVGSHQIALDLAKASGADRHVQIFYNISAPDTSTGNGDIWIDTTSPLNRDGSANTLSIYIANTYAEGDTYGDAGSPRLWHLDQTSALGRSALDGYNADQKSARSELMSLITVGDSSLTGSIPFPVYPAANGIMGVGATGNVKFHTPSYSPTIDSPYENPGEIDVINNGGIPFIGPDGIERTLTGLVQSNHIIYGGNFGEIYTRFEGTVSASQYTTEANTAYLMYTATAAASRFGGLGGYGQIGNIIAVVWDDDTESWYTYSNEGATEFPFIPDADQGDFLIARLRRPTTSSDLTIESWITSELPSQTRKFSDGKTVYFISNTFHSGSSEDHAYGPDPSTTPNGLINPEPYGDKWISMSSPYKTYLYFSNSSNKTSQTAFHAPVGPLAIAKYANTMWPYSTSNNNSGWYEYRDTGDALTQEGFQVALGQVSIGAAHWSENGQLVLDNITFDDDTDAGTAPAVVVTNTRDFGPNKELLLNPVPPPDQNLHAHWTFNSMGVDLDSGGNLVRYIPDISGRKNHATVRHFTENQAVFSPHDPAADVINVSGNHSLYSDGGDGDLAGGIVLGVDGSGSQKILSDGTRFPLDISDPSLFMKQTITMWYNPGDVTTMSTFERILSRNYFHHYLLSPHVGGEAFGPDGDEKSLKLYRYGTNVDDTGGNPVYLINSFTAPDGRWFGPPSTTNYGDDRDKRGALKSHTWHFFSLSFDYAQGNIELWVYREGEGLIWHEAMNFFTGATPSPGGIANYQSQGVDAPRQPRAIKLLESSLTASGIDNGSNRAQGWVDEVRLYNSLLTPRNIRYLYMNPTGRPQQLQPRPGIGVKKGYANFHDGGWQDGATHPDGYGRLYANSHAYFHGFDVDGNPADIDPYISFNGQVKYLDRGLAHLYIRGEDQGQKYYGNTGYILYNDIPYPAPTGIYPETKYVFAMPIGSNTTQPHTWMYQDFDDNNNNLLPDTLLGDPANFGKIGWKYFTPDDSKDLVIGEARLANSQQMITYAPGSTSGQHIQFDTVEAYQFARKPSIVRESYNFNIIPQDFIGSFGGGDHFFANSYWWANNLINGVFIAEATIGNAAIIELSAGKIQAGTIGVGVKVGGENKILLDGLNNRIVISD